MLTCVKPDWSCGDSSLFGSLTMGAVLRLQAEASREQKKTVTLLAGALMT